jgi:hypothetical protein
MVVYLRSQGEVVNRKRVQRLMRQLDPYALDPYALDPYALDPYALDPYALDR